MLPLMFLLVMLGILNNAFQLLIKFLLFLVHFLIIPLF